LSGKNYLFYQISGIGKKLKIFYYLKKQSWHPWKQTGYVRVLEQISVDHSGMNRVNLQMSASSIKTPLQALCEHYLSQLRI